MGEENLTLQTPRADVPNNENFAMFSLKCLNANDLQFTLKYYATLTKITEILKT